MEAAITRDDVQMEGGPIREKHVFAPLSLVGLEVPSTCFAVVDPQGASFHGESRKPMFISFAERTLGPTITPTCGATPAAEQPKTLGIDAYELSHGRRRSA